MTNYEINIKHAKELGEWAEMRFMARATEHGLRATKPWGESCRYDFVVDYKGVFRRVQIKSTRTKQCNSYYCHVRRGKQQRYTKDQIDFIAAYLIPVDVWYIFPIEITGSDTMVLSPDLEHSKHAVYKEAWHLLRGEEVRK